ncbi:glycosyltransferase [Amycolatopsis anabasis]|uniref:glycosyltransferase n=1 Tax=Amycolatopsis anabasis TaxID=1840409 RepID=UPI00131C5116|nr:nucleotide disphospho-sugar-binding domain-containing protein [Amycolatopsis anabasis]
MRILFSSIDGYGHTYPLLPLTSAAHRAGHEVVFATVGHFASLLKGLGVEHRVAGIPMGEAMGEALRSFPGVTTPDELEPQRRRELIAGVFGSVVPRRVIDDLTPLLREFEPDLVVASATSMGAVIATKRAGIPLVRHGIGRMVADPTLDTIKAAFTELATEFGLPGHRADEDPYLDIYPPSLQGEEFVASPNRYELRPVAFAESGELPARVRERDRSRPLAYLTLGTAFGTVDVLRSAIDGLAGLDLDLVVAAGPSVDLGELAGVPDNVFVESWVAQAELLPLTDLVVHHGGSGTTLGALAAGVPQLVLPQGADQFANADAVLGGGSGERLTPGEASAEAVAAQAKRLLTEDSFAAAARRIAAEIAAMPSPEEIAERLADFT